MAARLGVGAIAGGESGQVIGESTFGHNVDHTAHATVGRNTVDQGTRPFEHFNTLGILGKHAVVGCHAVDPIEGQFPQVAFAHRKAANEKGVDNPACLPRGSH
ncbi:hypothetical protein D3C78_1734030 [compost metagenome]